MLSMLVVPMKQNKEEDIVPWLQRGELLPALGPVTLAGRAGEDLPDLQCTGCAMPGTKRKRSRRRVENKRTSLAGMLQLGR